jgi:alkaline phosphatase D
MRRSFLAALLVLLAAIAAQTGSGAPEVVRGPQITHGVAAGEVTSSGAIIWARANLASTMRVQVATRPRIPRGARVRTVRVLKGSDYAGRVRLTRLRAGTRHYYRVWFTRKVGRGLVAGRAQRGSFVTAPAATRSSPVVFATSGDLGGQKYCRRPTRGYGIFAHIAALQPDFFVASGDMIYADDECPTASPTGFPNVPGNFSSIGNRAIDWTNAAQVRDTYLRHWRYNRADHHFQRLLRSSGLYSTWDDHEVLNDFGAAWPAYIHDRSRAGWRNLVAQGRAAFLNYGVVGGRIYRSFRWGRDVELFLLDGRSYRSENDRPDTPQNAKTMLGAPQLAWLKQAVARSGATWKLVVSNVALSVASGSDEARDSWANGHRSESPLYTGFERELDDLLASFDAANVRNLVVVSGDIHQARNLRYDADYNGDGDRLFFHELITGPLSATRNPPGSLDPTFRPTQLYAEGEFFNFRRIAVQGGSLSTDVRGEDGAVRPASVLVLTAQ